MATSQPSNALIEGAELGSEHVVLILVGLVASGKSTFAQALEDHYPQFRRCNQDDLGDRRRVEHLARQSLREGRSVCIDRTNFDALQRSHWIGIAREFPMTSIWLIVFDTPYEVCAARLRERTSHPTIKSPEQGLSVLSRFASDFRHPTALEGYDRIISLRPSDHTSPVYSRSDITAILQRVRDSPPVISSGSHAFAPNSTRDSPCVPRGHGYSRVVPASMNKIRGWGTNFEHGHGSGIIHNISGSHSAGSGNAWATPPMMAENQSQPAINPSP